MGKVGSRIAMCALVAMMALVALGAPGERAWAQDSPRGVEFSATGLRLNRAIAQGIPIPTGADAWFAAPLGGRGLYLTVWGGAGYTDRKVLRDPATGDPRPSPTSFDGAFWHQGYGADLAAGPSWRIMDRGADGAGMLLELFSALRARHETSLTSNPAAVFPDMRGLTAISALGGAAVDDTHRDGRRMRSGYAAEASFEWSPGFSAMTDGSGGGSPTDFLRASAWAKGYAPIAATSDDALGAWSLYAAGHLQADTAWGTRVPMYVLTSFGGRSLAGGLGSGVRGYPSWSYEALHKAVSNAELRLVGPALFGQPSIRPIFTAFADAGWYGSLDRASGAASSGLRWADASGILSSAGAGAAVGILDTAYLGARAGLRWAISDPLYGVYFTDGGTGAFFWDLTLLMHF